MGFKFSLPLEKKHPLLRILLTSDAQPYIAAQVTVLPNHLRLITAYRQTSPGKDDRFPLIYPPEFTVCALGSTAEPLPRNPTFGLCFEMQTRPAQFSL